MILLTIILVVLVLVIIVNVKSLISYITIIKYLQKLPGPPCTSIFSGNISPLYDTPENAFKAVRKWSREYYPIYQNWVAHITVANVVNPYDFEIILSNMKHNTKSKVYEMMHNWLGTGLLTSDGAKWQTRRKILTPSFHFNILQEFLKIFNKETERLVATFKRECDKPYICLNDHISGFTLNTIGETAMGTNFDTEIVNGQKYKKAIHEIGQVYIYRLLRPWLISKLLYFFNYNYHKERKLVKLLHQFTSEVIRNREKNFKPLEFDKDHSYSTRKRMAMLDLLLTAKNVEGTIDDEGVREEVDTFMFEGHDTTAVAICFALMLIAKHPEVQNKIVEEVHKVFGDCQTPPTYAKLQELKYTEMCIKEVLRMYPSVPFIARILGEDIVTHSGYLLKAGSMVHLHIYDLHHNPDIYPDPEKFDPERFLPENCQNRHYFAYVPFSAGPRNCIGQKFAILEIKTVLCGILSEFVLEPVDTSDVLLITDLVLRAKDTIKVKLIPRVKKVID